MSLDSLQSLFLDELKDVYHAEKQLVEALPRMAKAADSAELQQAFSDHLAETKGQVERLERILQELGQPRAASGVGAWKGCLRKGRRLQGGRRVSDRRGPSRRRSGWSTTRSLAGAAPPSLASPRDAACC
jgi:ferritin-like metal-binding protein YciE